MTPLQKGTYVTQIAWFPAPVGGARKQLELFILTCTDGDEFRKTADCLVECVHRSFFLGRFLLVSSVGRVEKAVEAHKGAVLGALWNHDGTALVTSTAPPPPPPPPPHTHTHTHVQ